MLKVTQKRIALLNRLPFTHVTLDVLNANGKRIDGVSENFQDGKEIQKAEWIASKTDILSQNYPAQCITQDGLLGRISVLESQVSLLQKPVTK